MTAFYPSSTAFSLHVLSTSCFLQIDIRIFSFWREKYIHNSKGFSCVHGDECEVCIGLDFWLSTIYWRQKSQEVFFLMYIFLKSVFFKYSSLFLLNNSTSLKLLSASPLPLPNVLMSNLRHELQLQRSRSDWGGGRKMKSEVLFSESKGGDNFY